MIKTLILIIGVMFMAYQYPQCGYDEAVDLGMLTITDFYQDEMSMIYMKNCRVKMCKSDGVLFVECYEKEPLLWEKHLQNGEEKGD